MSLTTVVQTCPTWLFKLTKTSQDKLSEQNYQVINRKISQGSCLEPKDKSNYNSCPGNPNKPPSSTCHQPVGSYHKGNIPPHIYKENNMQVGMMDNSRIVGLLHSVREPLAEYQEKRGLSRTESCTFVNVVTSLCQHAYNAAITILTMLYNLLPLMEGFLYFARFFLDKLIEIFETEDTKEKAMKTVLFIAEMIVILVMIIIICGLILVPVWHLFSQLLSKVWGMFAG